MPEFLSTRCRLENCQGCTDLACAHDCHSVERYEFEKTNGPCTSEQNDDGTWIPATPLGFQGNRLDVEVSGTGPWEWAAYQGRERVAAGRARTRAGLLLAIVRVRLAWRLKSLWRRLTRRWRPDTTPRFGPVTPPPDVLRAMSAAPPDEEKPDAS